MKIYKILIGTVLLASLLSASISSKVKYDDFNAKISNGPVITLAEKKEAEMYILRQEALHKAVRDYFENAIKEGDIVGVGLSIVNGDSVVISEGFGKRNIKDDKLVNGETVFRLGSISKGFASTLTAALKREGKIAWGDKVVDFIPDFKFGDQANSNSINIVHVLSHTSGTPYHSFTNLVEAGLPISEIALRFKEVTPISRPGHQYSYQNAMYSLSQEIMYKATGKDIKTLLTNTFFKPLDMSMVSMDHQSLLKTDNVAIPHRKSGTSWRSLPLTDKYYNAIAAGGINASAVDMAKWMRFLLGHNPEVMDKVAIEEIFQPYIELKEQRKYYQRWPGHIKSAYGLGWRIHTMKTNDPEVEETIWHHGGSVNGYRNEIALFPKDDLGICVLVNSHSRLASTVIPDLYAIVKSIFKQEIIPQVSL